MLCIISLSWRKGRRTKPVNRHIPDEIPIAEHPVPKETTPFMPKDKVENTSVLYGKIKIEITGMKLTAAVLRFRLDRSLPFAD